VSLLPAPVITRCRGTWLDAAVYYADHLTDIRNIFDKLDSEDAFLNVLSIEANLVYIQSNYGILSTNATRLESFWLL